MNRIEQAIPAGIICVIGIWVAVISYTQTPTEAFVFPRLVSTVFAVLAAWTFLRTLIAPEDTHASIPWETWARILPGLGVAVVYVFWLGQALGFYTATALAVFALVSFYDPAPHDRMASWIRRALITAGFMAVLYALFAMLLGVFTPRELLFK